MATAEPVLVQVPATLQRTATVEKVITLDLDPTEVVPPSQNAQQGTVSAYKSTSKRAVKRTYTEATSNTAPDFSQMADAVSDDEQYYPAYLFQNVPSKLQMENLRKMALISIIETNKAEQNVLDMLKGCVGPFKNALLAMCGEHVPENREAGDHAYPVRSTSTNAKRLKIFFRSLLSCQLRSEVAFLRAILQGT